MRLELHVRPGSSAPSVGGEHDGALVVRVAEPAEGGRATEAALRSIAQALGLPRRSVRLVRGATSRRKVVDLDLGARDADSLASAVATLRGRTTGS